MRALFLLLAAAATATASAPPTTVIRSPDQLDYVLMLDGRPVTVRLHLRAGERPYDGAMADWAARLFKWFDRDGDGYLSGAEAARLLPADRLNFLARGSIRGDRPPSVPFAGLDKDKDGKVSPGEFRAFLSRGFPALTVNSQTFRADQSARVNDALWRRLDADGDGRLTEAELAKLPALVARLDENEDEMLSEAELLQEGSDVYGFAPRPVRPGGPPPQVLVRMGEVPAGQVAAMLVREYGKGKRSKLTREDIGLDEAEFAALDLDRDGKLDARELERFVLREPDLTFRARVGTMTGAAGIIDGLGLGPRMGLSPQRVALLTPSGKGLTRGLSRLSPDMVRLKRGQTEVEIMASAGQRVNRGGARNFYLQNFDSLLQDKAKGLTRAQAEENVYIAGLFSPADRNADGLLERKELTDFLALVGEGSSASVTLTLDDGGRSLFSVIDTNLNGQLSVREMRTAWSRVKGLCKGGKGLAREDLPRRVRIDLTEGENFNRGVPVAVGGPRPLSMFVGAAPAWFAKMDRNGDGDISASEWLGSEEEFKRLDLDGDGLLSVAEAMKAGTPDPTKKK